jgi:predicted GTPase
MVGQTKSGKSSLINELLGKTIVTADQRPCTARLVELQYDNVATPVVTVRAKDGRVLDQVTCKKNNIPGMFYLLQRQMPFGNHVDSHAMT